MSDDLPPLADLLPHLHAGDRITAVINMGAGIQGTFENLTVELKPERAPGLFVRIGYSQWRMIYLHKPGLRAHPAPPLVAIASAPDAHKRYLAAHQPTWADGTPADDETVAMVEDVGGLQWVRTRFGLWRPQSRQFASAYVQADVIKRGARPVARYVTDQPAPEHRQLPNALAPTECPCLTCLKDAGVPVWWMVVCDTCGNKRCPKTVDHRNQCTGSNNPDQPAPEPATCDRDHEPPIGSVVRTQSGTQWHRKADFWHISWSVDPLYAYKSWAKLWKERGPLTLVGDGTNTGAEQ